MAAAVQSGWLAETREREGLRDQIKSDLKQRLYRQAARRRMSAAYLLRLYIKEGLARDRVL